MCHLLKRFKLLFPVIILLATVMPACGPMATGAPTPTSPSSTVARIAFASNRDGNSEIYVMNVDGSDLTRLTNNPTNDGYPAWSPDGERIAFISDRDGNREIYLMNADGSGQTNLTNNPAHDRSPAWQPGS